MKIQIIADTNKKMSFEDEKTEWNKEYALLTFESPSEIDAYYKEHPIRDIMEYSNPVLGLRRRVDYRNGEEFPREWEVITVQASEAMVAIDIGDSDFYDGNSLCELHQKIVAYCNKMNELRTEQNKIYHYVYPSKNTLKSGLDEHYQNLYNEELKNRRIFTAAKNEEADPELIKTIKNSLQTAYNEEKYKLEKRLEELDSQMKNLWKEYFG